MTEKADTTSNNVAASHAPGAKVLAALVKAMGQVQKVSKESRNKHDGYNFASIDDFLALVNPICAENGLIPHMDEYAREDFERQGRSGTSTWMRQTFVITLMHVSGETLPPVYRTVEVLRNGAQAYGSAQSYALKQFWRCILLIPTGDKDDADHGPTDAGPVSNVLQNNPQVQKANEAAVIPQKEIDAALSAINRAESLDDLKTAWTALRVPVRALSAVQAAKDARKTFLDDVPPPITEDEIRY